MTGRGTRPVTCRPDRRAAGSARPATCTTCAARRRCRPPARGVPRSVAAALLAQGERPAGAHRPARRPPASVPPSVSAGELELARRAGFPPGDDRARGHRQGRRGAPGGGRRGRRAVEPLLWVSLESADEARALAALAAVPALGWHRVPSMCWCASTRGSSRRPTAGSRSVPSGSKFGVLADELPELIEAGGGTDGSAPLAGHPPAHRLAAGRGRRLALGDAGGAAAADPPACRAARLRHPRPGVRLRRSTTASTAPCPGPEVFAEAAADEVAATARDARPRRLAIEPGRAVVAAEWLARRSRAPCPGARTSPDGQTRLVVLDTGMTELIRPALYGAEHPMVALTSQGRLVEPATGTDAASASMGRSASRPTGWVSRTCRRWSGTTSWPSASSARTARRWHRPTTAGRDHRRSAGTGHG